MISALLYLQVQSVKNRLRSQVKRLKQPKYLIAAIVGGLWLYAYFLRHLFYSRGGRAGWGSATPETLALFESIGAAILLIIILLAWLIPRERAALAFTEPEVAFLFPAPISRRGLIHFKLLRSQLGILFTTLFLVLLSTRFSGRTWFFHAAGWWVILSTLNLHFLGSSFARTLLLDRGITNRTRRLAVVALAIAGVAAIVLWARRTLPTATPIEWQNLDDVRRYFQLIFSSGPAPYLLYPFRILVRPWLAPDTGAFLVALGPALLVMLLHYAWVVRSDVSFEEASMEASRRTAEKLAAIRSGEWHSSGRRTRARRAPFRLAPTGFPAVALLWKNLIHTGSAVTTRTGVMLLIVAVVVSFSLQGNVGRAGWLPTLGILAVILLVWSVLLGPQVLRQDFRHDLRVMDVLKVFPMPGWQVVLGQVLAPATVLTGIQWVLLVLALGFFPQAQTSVGWPILIAFGFGAALILPVLNGITLLIPNAAVLVFPGWFQAGKEGAQGIEATGQRLISMLAQMLVLGLALIPAGIVFTVVLLLAKLVLPLALAVPLASLAATVVLAAEAAAGIALLGRVFEKFDLTA